MTVSKRILSSLYKAAGKEFSDLADDIQAAGGQVYFVGGCVGTSSWVSPSRGHARPAK